MSQHVFAVPAVAAVSFGTSAQCAAPITDAQKTALVTSQALQAQPDAQGSAVAGRRAQSSQELANQGIRTVRGVLVLALVAMIILARACTLPVGFGVLCVYALLEYLVDRYMYPASATSSSTAAPSTSAPPEGAAQSKPGWEIRPYFNGQSLVVAAAMNGGNAIAELVHAVQQWGAVAAAGDKVSTAPDDAAVYAKLEQCGEAAVANGALGALSFKPTFLPERNAVGDDSAMLAQLKGVAAGQLGDVGAVYAALLRGLSENLVSLLPPQVVRDCMAGKPVAVSGGAVVRSGLLRQSLQSATRCSSIEVCADADAALGAALRHLTTPAAVTTPSLRDTLAQEPQVGVSGLRARVRRKGSGTE